MRRLSVAAGLAIAIHGFLFLTHPGWLKTKMPLIEAPRLIQLSLSPVPLKKPEPRSLLPAQDSVPKKEPIVLRKKIPHNSLHVPRSVKVISVPPKEESKALRPVESALSAPGKRQVTGVLTSPKEKLALGPDSLVEDDSLKETVDMSGFEFYPAKPATDQERGEGKREVSQAGPPETVHKARPAYRKNPTPRYPKLARRRGYQGKVTLEVLVNRKGRVEDLRIFRSSGYRILDMAAVTCVRGWVFEPASIGERKVAMWVRIPVRFQLR